MNKIFYQHEKLGFCGDFIPFFWNGIYHFYTIIDGHWEHLTTSDFVSFENHGVAIPCGSDEEQDRMICTGSIFEWEGTFHCFYAGYNPAFTGIKPFQVVLHATSKDLFTWKKEKDVFLPPDESIYHRDGWRDPFVWRDEKHQDFRMIITGEEHIDNFRRWGAVALATSRDLINWKVEKPLYAPHLYDTHECPDFFKMGKKWYLIFSTYTRWWENHYRIANSSDGPFFTPKDEVLDNRSFYAAKTIFDGKRRILVGWAAMRDKNSDKEKYLWGGNFCAHELRVGKNYELECHPIKEVVDYYNQDIEITPEFKFGNGSFKFDDKVVNFKSDGFSVLKLTDVNTDNFYFSCDVELKDNVVAGVLLRADTLKFDKWAAVEINRKKDILYFDHVGKWFDDQFFDETRPLTKSKKYHLDIISMESMIVVYCNGKALSTRCYEQHNGEIGLSVRDGKVKFSNIKIRKVL